LVLVHERSPVHCHDGFWSRRFVGECAVVKSDLQYSEKPAPKSQRLVAGQATRFPAEEEGRFIPANTEQWLSTFTLQDRRLDDVYRTAGN
jgi:hypothetical protein